MVHPPFFCGKLPVFVVGEIIACTWSTRGPVISGSICMVDTALSGIGETQEMMWQVIHMEFGVLHVDLVRIIVRHMVDVRSRIAEQKIID